MSGRDVTALARRLGRACLRRGIWVSAAESCTGGGIAEAITRIPGSSAWFDRGFVTYSNEAKRQMLGVPAGALEKHGAVSAEVARAMVRGALRRSRADVGVAVTGVAGPGGGSRAKPVGLVWIAWGYRGRAILVREHRFRGGRESVRKAAICASIQGLADLIGEVFKTTG